MQENKGGIRSYYKGFNIYYDAECDIMVVYERYGWQQEKVRDICYIKNVKEYKDEEIDTFLRMIIDTCPPIEELNVDGVKVWDMREWIEKIRTIM